MTTDTAPPPGSWRTGPPTGSPSEVHIAQIKEFFEKGKAWSKSFMAGWRTVERLNEEGGNASIDTPSLARSTDFHLQMHPYAEAFREKLGLPLPPLPESVLEDAHSALAAFERGGLSEPGIRKLLLEPLRELADFTNMVRWAAIYAREVAEQAQMVVQLEVVRQQLDAHRVHLENFRHMLLRDGYPLPPFMLEIP